MARKYGPAQPSTPEETAAYIRGLCVDCKTEKYSAGRPRCNKCHANYEKGIW